MRIIIVKTTSFFVIEFFYKYIHTIIWKCKNSVHNTSKFPSTETYAFNTEIDNLSADSKPVAAASYDLSIKSTFASTPYFPVG